MKSYINFNYFMSMDSNTHAHTEVSKGLPLPATCIGSTIFMIDPSNLESKSERKEFYSTITLYLCRLT